MYSFTIAEEHAGKSILEIITYLQETDDFKCKLGVFTETSCIVSLDGKIIIYPAFSSTIVYSGQLLKFLPLVAGG